MITAFLFILCLLTTPAAHGQSINALPLLSDLAYYDLKKSVAALTASVARFTPPDPNFDHLLFRWNHQDYSAPFQIDEGSVRVLLPVTHIPAADSQVEMLGFKDGRLVWKHDIKLTLGQRHLPTITAIKPFAQFRGGLIFADAYQRISVDHSEPYARENAVFIRGVNHDLATNVLLFDIPTQSKIPRDPVFITTKHRQLLMASSHGAQQIDLASGQSRAIPSSSAGSSFTHKHPCFFHLNSSTQLRVTLKANRLDLEFHPLPCSQPTGFLKHLWRNTEPWPAQTTTVKLPPKLAAGLKGKKIHRHQMSRTTQKHRFYALLLTTSTSHRFTQKDPGDDYVLVLDEDLKLDGAFAITTHYYSPRYNVGFYPGPDEFSEYFRHQEAPR